MTNIQPITNARHGSLRWLKVEDFQWAKKFSVTPLAAAEISIAALSFPLAFTWREDYLTLSAVLGLFPQQNLFVNGQGRWLASYIPASLRSHPFLIGVSADGQATLCIDESSGLLTGDSDGERFYDESGDLCRGVAEIGSFLSEIANGERILVDACDYLQKVNIIRPWPIAIQDENGIQTVDGLFRIDEAGLNSLDDAAFCSLRRSGALAIAYAQLLSMSNLKQLGHLAQARAQAEAAERARAEVKPMLHLPADNTIDWDWSKIGR